MKVLANLKCLFLLCFIAHSSFLCGQSTSENRKERIVNAVSEESIPYVHVYIKSLNKGTVSNLNGEFFLENVKLTDTLVFSFLGCDTWEVSAKDLVESEIVKLYPATEVLNEVTLVNNDEFLYELLAGCKKTLSRKVKTAKTYFSLKPF